MSFLAKQQSSANKTLHYSYYIVLTFIPETPQFNHNASTKCCLSVEDVFSDDHIPSTHEARMTGAENCIYKNKDNLVTFSFVESHVYFTFVLSSCIVQ